MKRLELLCSFGAGIAISAFTNVLTGLKENHSVLRALAMGSFFLCSFFLYRAAEAMADAARSRDSVDDPPDGRQFSQTFNVMLRVRWGAVCGAIAMVLLILDFFLSLSEKGS